MSGVCSARSRLVHATERVKKRVLFISNTTSTMCNSSTDAQPWFASLRRLAARILHRATAALAPRDEEIGWGVSGVGRGSVRLDAALHIASAAATRTNTRDIPQIRSSHTAVLHRRCSAVSSRIACAHRIHTCIPCTMQPLDMRTQNLATRTLTQKQHGYTRARTRTRTRTTPSHRPGWPSSHKHSHSAH